VRVSLDTNLLVYAADSQAGDRHGGAVALTRRAVGGDCVLCLQCLAEFFHAVTRKGVMTPKDAHSLVDEWRTVFPVHAASEESLLDAIRAHREHGLAFWDAMLWATARDAGCGLLISEDFQDGRTLGGVTFVNPFLERNDTLLRAALAPIP
jgi:predicted nucleic acid-binding protein